MVESCSMACKGQREVRQVMCMDLRLVCSCAHNPFSVITDPYTRASFFKFEILQQFHTICIFRVVFQTALPLAGEPVWQRSRCRSTRYSIYWYFIWVGELHDDDVDPGARKTTKFMVFTIQKFSFLIRTYRSLAAGLPIVHASLACLVTTPDCHLRSCVPNPYK